MMKWLHMDEENRPGLIMAYCDEPDATGHRDSDTKGIREKRQFLPFDVNVGIENKRADWFASDGKMRRNPRTTEDILKSLKCKTQGNARVFTKETMPIRYHYPKSRRVGDIVVVGVDGAVILEEPADVKFWKVGTHGYDFIVPSINMIMFARGPSFKENYVLPPFQNVEYMNLWTTIDIPELLGIPMVKSDGDPWFMDLALKNYTTPQPVYRNVTGCSKEDKVMHSVLESTFAGANF
ncbi:hypothetical protein TELCIR_08130 [Teladorsagia circumcincta]|uniref:Uncharacterized protein n=1 Tax=Teladorsagia circumcincta TaxID=45464 RepID=A0A2G9UIF0_TELCI|nr:hypothetical protein TELCIR_08130 [Teladorsagia circumcincta]